MLLIYMVVLTESRNKKWLYWIFTQQDDLLQINLDLNASK